MKNKNDRKASPWKSIKVGAASFLVMVIFAYGFQITKVNLEELSSEQRQESLIRVVRALAKPVFLRTNKKKRSLMPRFMYLALQMAIFLLRQRKLHPALIL